MGIKRDTAKHLHLNHNISVNYVNSWVTLLHSVICTVVVNSPQISLHVKFAPGEDILLVTVLHTGTRETRQTRGYRAQPTGKILGANTCSSLNNFNHVPSVNTDCEMSTGDPTTSYSSDEQENIKSKFMYLLVIIHSRKVAALVDTGSSINILSADLFYSLPNSLKTSLNSYVQESIILANNQKIHVLGTCTVQMTCLHTLFFSLNV